MEIWAKKKEGDCGRRAGEGSRTTQASRPRAVSWTGDLRTGERLAVINFTDAHCTYPYHLTSFP
jgi:hypothetical protein